MQAWFTFLSYDRGCIMCREEYEQAVRQLREFSANPQKAKQYSSYDRWQSDHKQHRRVDWNPQTSLQEPLTATQQVGAVEVPPTTVPCLTAAVLGLEAAQCSPHTYADFSNCKLTSQVAVQDCYMTINYCILH